MRIAGMILILAALAACTPMTPDMYPEHYPKMPDSAADELYPEGCCL